ncbi:MAG: primosomal protein N' [Deltaproteobacteria bacterium]|nr:primosomal protein N' [Deltaproteobacteria bacterium]
MAVDSPAPDYFSYLAPPDTEIMVGQMVRVNLNGRELLGYVMGPDNGGPAEGRGYKLKAISQVVVPEPLFGQDLVDLVGFVSRYYMYPPGLCVKEILPGGLSPKLKVGYRITGKGLALVGEGPSALGLMAEAYPEAVPAAKVAGRGGPAKPGELRRLLRKGLAEVVYDMDGQWGGFTHEWYVSPVGAEGPLPRLGPKEAEFYGLVKDAPPTPMKHYRDVLGFNPHVQAKNLCRKGLVAMERRERFRDDPSRALSVAPTSIESLTGDQERAVAAINGAIGGGERAGFLLFGVTGSGKTEVYLRAAERALAKGKGVLWLAPEIALTMGLEGRLKERFPGQDLSILHSGLTPGQRHDHWVALRRGRAKLALGARSAVFAPIADLGLIIVDEEHDWAYKQDEGLRYHGRDLAAWRAQASGAVLVLGSATPSLESYHRSLEGKLTLLRLQSRPGLAVLPEVRIIDLRLEGKRYGPIAHQVKANLKDTFERGEQALMFINRRGLANLPLCLSCGEVIKCPHCSLSLTLHSNFDRVCEAGEGDDGLAELRADNLLVCHGCGYRARPPSVCPKCKSKLFRYLGVGTESLIREMEKSFGKRGLRLDTDSTRLKGGLKDILESFSAGEADFLVGTQMAAKGHDFPNLTMVGVVEADIGLNVADFRAAERTFQLLSQVAGRAGRRERPGAVFIQTRNPDHYSMTSARDHDYETFFANEIAIRRELGYPPFSRMALIRFSGPESGKVEEEAQWAADRARALSAAKAPGEIEIFGPAPCPMTKLKEKYRHQIMVRADRAEDRHRLLRRLLPEVRKRKPVDIGLTVDVDPYNLM